MNLFGRRQVVDETARADIGRLRDELVRAESVVRQIEAEVIGMHDQVRRWMRRAVAAERAVERNQEPQANGNGLPYAAATPASPAPAVPSRVNLRGARARIAFRQRLEHEASRNGHTPGTANTVPTTASHAADTAPLEAPANDSEE